MGGDRPEQKPFLSGSLGPKSARVGWGTKAPEGGELDKVPHPPKIWTQFSPKKIDDFFFNFRRQRGPRYYDIHMTDFAPPPPRERDHRKKKKKITLGDLAPKFDPRPHVPRNLSRGRRGAHDPEKISEIAQAVAEKIKFLKNFVAPWRPDRKRSRLRDHTCRKLSLGTRMYENIKTLGLEMTTLFDFFDISFGPTNGMSRKILLYTHVRRPKTLLRSRNP